MKETYIHKKCSCKNIISIKNNNVKGHANQIKKQEKKQQQINKWPSISKPNLTSGVEKFVQMTLALAFAFTSKVFHLDPNKLEKKKFKKETI